jgi:ssDNA-binding Zn-finger/Zn-ribbon topoisomerase 1
MHSISWNQKAVEQSKAQGVDNPKNATCPTCGTQPALRQFRQYSCECGELRGAEARHTAWRG